MHAAIYVPRFALQALQRTMPVTDPGHAPAAVLEVTESPLEKAKEDQQRLLHVNAAAERQGVHAGMAAGMALARCPRLTLLHRHISSEEAAQHVLLECAAQWTPDYETTAPGLCVLDVSRVRGLAHRLDECGRDMHAHLAALRLQACVGIAPGADLAALAAHAAQPVMVWRDARADGTAYLRDLPVRTLGPAPDAAELLRLWGIRTLGELVRLPRQEVVLRMGHEGARLWDTANGGKERLLRLVRPAVRYHDAMDLVHPVESLEPLLFLLRRMLDTLCHRLAESWLVASAMQLLLGFEDGHLHEAALRIAEPSRDAGLLLRLLHTHLEGLSTSAPIIRIALELVPIRPAGSQMHIFERGMRDPNRFAETLAQIEAVVGSGHVGRVRLRPSRALDAFEVVAFLEQTNVGKEAPLKPARRKKPAPEEAPSLPCDDKGRTGLPLRRMRPSRPVEVTLCQGKPAEFHTNAKHHFITACTGPWLVSGDWWTEARWQRELWEVQTSEGVLYQLTRHNGEWQLEGVFG